MANEPKRRAIRMTDEQLKLMVALVGNHTYGAHKEIFQLYEKMLDEHSRRGLGKHPVYRFKVHNGADRHIIDTREPEQEPA